MRLKKIVAVLVLILLLFNSASVFAATSSNVEYRYYYVDTRDQYRLDYWSYPSNSNSIFVEFQNTTGDIWTQNWDREAIIGIIYLTCKGNYDVYFRDSANQTVASITGLDTSSIVSGSCESYVPGYQVNDLNARVTGGTGFNYSLEWDPVSGASSYEIYKNGTLVNTVNSTKTGVSGDGSYTIRAVDSSGNTLGESDINLNGNCEVCSKLDQLLQCPGWDQLMGELTTAMQNALTNYWGATVPTPPTAQEIKTNIEPPLPVLDTSVPDANTGPAVPGEYNQPMSFDISTGPEISVIDESVPITVYEPNHYIDSDAPGVMVFPGDTRNSSGGIKTPDTITTPYPTPVPTLPSEYNTPPAAIPIPGASTGTIPVPSGSGDMTGPVPTITITQ